MSKRLTEQELLDALALGLCETFRDDDGFGCEPEEPPCVGHVQQAADILDARPVRSEG